MFSSRMGARESLSEDDVAYSLLYQTPGCQVEAYIASVRVLLNSTTGGKVNIKT